MKDQIKKLNQEQIQNLKELLEVMKQQGREECLRILEEEIATAHTSESGKTSRLTSAYMRIKKLK